jgi:EAL domain-containing protein (putative c-di-GMP-specific phosphodiesterase class I)
VYQPVIDLASGRVEGAEALARWFNGTVMVQPADFIPIAEESGLILPIGEAILLEACTKAAAWRDAGLDLDISVNVSARQVVRHDFFDVVERSLALAGLGHEHLVLELTESVLLDVIGSASDRIQQLRDLGVRFSIDDFGTGFSSLAYLHDLTVDQLKIDRRFTAGLGIHPQDDAIVASIITLSKELGLDLIAEGVETEAQADHLLRLGCERAQGFLFSRPVSDLELARQAAPVAQMP